MTTILITGAAGFIGSRIADHFRQAGHRVCVDAAPGAARSTLTAGALAALADGQAPDAIIHAAGSGTVGAVAADPATHLAGNLAALLAVLEYARALAPSTRVVLLSSAAVYGSAPARPQREDDARPPLSLYGLSKAQCEQVLGHYAAHYGIRTTAIRLFSVYGPGLRKQLLWDAMNKFAAGRRDFFGTGQEMRDWVHVDDVGRFMRCLLARAPAAPFEVFNCGGQPATTAQVLARLAELAGAGAPVFNGQGRPGDPACMLADCARAAQALGWQAQVPWREGLQQYADWYGGIAASPSLHSAEGGR